MEQFSNGKEQNERKSWFQKDAAFDISFIESGIRAIVDMLLLVVTAPVDLLLPADRSTQIGPSLAPLIVLAKRHY